MNSSHTVSQMLAETRQTLVDSGIESPADAELIVAHVMNVSRGEMLTAALLDQGLGDDLAQRVRDLAEERARRVPLQHLIGKAPFRHLELEVGPGVFIPRAETETVAQNAIDTLQAVMHPTPIVVDLCTGSGAIALALATEVPTAQVWAVERSEMALAWAQRNVTRYGDDRVRLIQADVSEVTEVLPELVGNVHVVVTNPPYIPEGMIPKDPEVRDHDPELALYGGSDGLDVIRVISVVARDLLVGGGALVCEHAEHQGEQVRNILHSQGWRTPATHQDLTRRDRFTTALR